MNARRWGENEGLRCLSEEESEKKRAVVHGDVSRVGAACGLQKDLTLKSTSHDGRTRGEDGRRRVQRGNSIKKSSYI